jgi:hypothetical protein
MKYRQWPMNQNWNDGPPNGIISVTTKTQEGLTKSVIYSAIILV